MKRFPLGPFVVLVALSLMPALCGGRVEATERDLVSEVQNAERAFAKTMADRDLKSFGTYIAEEGVFFDRSGPLRGRQAVVAVWKRYFEGKEAPFSWEPQTVEVLDSGTLALTHGPVWDTDGETQIGTFTTIWRLEPDGKWRVVFDRGCPVCPPSERK